MKMFEKNNLQAGSKPLTLFDSNGRWIQNILFFPFLDPNFTPTFLSQITTPNQNCFPVCFAVVADIYFSFFFMHRKPGSHDWHTVRRSDKLIYS